MYSYAKVGRFLEVTKMGCKCHEQQHIKTYPNLFMKFIIKN